MKSKTILAITILFLFSMSMIHAFVSEASADGRVSLTWTPPTLNCDDSTLTDLSGYVVKWWFQNTPSVVVEQDVGNVSSTTIDLIGDVEGKTVVFVVVSYDAHGNRSDDPEGCGASNPVNVPFAVTFPRPPTAVGAAQVP